MSPSLVLWTVWGRVVDRTRARTSEADFGNLHESTAHAHVQVRMAARCLLVNECEGERERNVGGAVHIISRLYAAYSAKRLFNRHAYQWGGASSHRMTLSFLLFFEGSG